MKRIHVLLALLASTLLGSLFMILASNMFFSDILNAGAGAIPGGLFVSLPAISVAMFFVLAIFYFLRASKHPDCKKRITRTYSIILMCLSFLGVLGAILGGVVYYHTLVGPNPFPGYLIIFLILNLLLCGLAVFAFLKARKMEEDEDRVKINPVYVIKTIGWFLFICLVFNRLGTFLFSPMFIYWRNFYATFPFYLFLLVPTLLGFLECCHILDLLPPKRIKILTFVGLGLTVVLVTYTAIMGANDTTFVSSLSQAMPLERMLSKPIELPIHGLACVGVAIALLLQTKKAKEE